MSLIVVESRAYPLGRADVDTDMIVASEWLKVITRKGLGKAAFGALRQETGNVFDDPAFAGAAILIAGENFGCGSSREHAAWAMADMGIRVVIAPSFSSIFSGNAFKNGILTVDLPGETVAELLSAAQRSVMIKVDLERCQVSAEGAVCRFVIDPFRRRCLMEGIDEIALTLEDAADIAAHERRISEREPWLTGIGLSG